MNETMTISIDKEIEKWIASEEGRIANFWVDYDATADERTDKSIQALGYRKYNRMKTEIDEICTIISKTKMSEEEIKGLLKQYKYVSAIRKYIDPIGETGIQVSIDEATDKKDKDGHIIYDRVYIVQFPKLVMQSGNCYDLFGDKTTQYEKIVFVNHENKTFEWDIQPTSTQDLSVFATKIISKFSFSTGWHSRQKYLDIVEGIISTPEQLQEYYDVANINTTNAFGFRNGKYYGVEYELPYSVDDPIAPHIQKTIDDEHRFSSIRIDENKVKDTIRKIHSICEANQNGYYVLGWSMMSMLRLDILTESDDSEKFGIFPILGLFGIKGAGKSTLMQLFVNDLWGTKLESGNILQGTGIRLEPFKGRTKPLGIDEVKEINFEQLRHIATTAVFSTSRGTKSGHVIRRDTSLPISVNGNNIVFSKEDKNCSASTDATVSRFLFLKFDKKMEKAELGIKSKDMAMLGHYTICNILPQFNMKKLNQLKMQLKTKNSRDSEVEAIRDYSIEMVKTLFKTADIEVNIPALPDVNIADFAKTPATEIYDNLFKELNKVIKNHNGDVYTWLYTAKRANSEGIGIKGLNDGDMSVIKDMEQKGIYITTNGDGLLINKECAIALGHIGKLELLFDMLNSSDMPERFEKIEIVMQNIGPRSAVNVITDSGYKGVVKLTPKTGILFHLKEDKYVTEDENKKDIKNGS